MHLIKSTILLLALLGTAQVFAQQARLRQIDPQTTGIEIQVDGLSRRFIVHVPPAYAKNPAQSFPVVMMFHGGGGSGQKYFNISGWKEYGDQEGIITVFPSALETCLDRSDGRSSKPYWMTEGKLAQLCPQEKPRDDVAFVRAIVSYLKSEYRTDPRRYYACGFSNGMGFILSKLMAEMQDSFAAFAGVGSLLQHAGTPIASARPLIALIGSKDDHFTGPAGVRELPTDEAGIETIPFLKTMQQNLLTPLQLSTIYQVRERPKYIAYRFTGSAGNGAPELQFAIMKGLGHVFPHGRVQQDNGIVAAKVAWNFFQPYSLP